MIRIFKKKDCGPFNLNLLYHVEFDMSIVLFDFAHYVKAFLQWKAFLLYSIL